MGRNATHRPSAHLPQRAAAPGAHTPGGADFTQLVIEIFRVYGTMIAVGDALVRDLDMTSARWQVLGAIGKEPKTVAAAARHMGLTRQNVQRIANSLVESGIADYVDNPNHRRAKLVALTKKGMALREQLGRRQAKWANESALPFAEGELAATIEVLQRLRKALEKKK